jgi:hypothetical protein
MDRITMGLVLVGISAHPVWIGLIFAYFFGYKLHLTPIAGSRDYTGFEWAETTSAARRCARLSWREDVARRTAVARRAAYGIRLRAYDGNMLGYARLRDVLTNRRSETLK